MGWNDWTMRLRALFSPRGVERELDEELSFHLAMEEEKNRTRGLGAPEAERLAWREFGGVEQFREECRDARGLNTIENLARDVFSWPMLESARRSGALAETIGYSQLPRLNVMTGGESRVTGGIAVTGNYFSGLGVKMALGRMVLAVAVLAVAVPARRAMATDPVRALRYEQRRVSPSCARVHKAEPYATWILLFMKYGFQSVYRKVAGSYTGRPGKGCTLRQPAN
jgi:hypothetical protein